MLAGEFKVSGPLATSAGKRWQVPPHLFEVNEKPKFSSAERLNPVYLYYPYREIHEVHITLPANMESESLPPDDDVKVDFAPYKTIQKLESPATVFSPRGFSICGIAVPAGTYPDCLT